MVETATGRIHTVSAPTAALDPWPIPESQITGGSPQAAGRFLWQSEDKRLGNGVWTCAPGSFTWEYTWDETIYLLEGEVTIADQDGNSNTYRAGDLFFVPAGTSSSWEVTKAVRKVFHLRSDTPVEL
jgi:uncharacterized cupin superfamily protein